MNEINGSVLQLFSIWYKNLSLKNLLPERLPFRKAFFAFHWLTSFLLLVRGESVTALTSALIMNALKREVNKELLTFLSVADVRKMKGVMSCG